MNDKNPSISLNNGVEMPALGFGVFLTPPEQTAAAAGTGFTLSEEELSAIDALDTGVRAGSDPETFDASSYPVAIDEA